MTELEETGALPPVEDDRMANRSDTSFSTYREDSEEAGESGLEEFAQIQPNYLVDEALEHCKRFLRLYYIGIKIFGWTQLTRENGRALRVIRWCLVFFWNLLLILTFTLQALTCYTRDRFNPGSVVNNTRGIEREISCTPNVVILLVAQDILILITYWVGLNLFSREEKEYTLYLAEKTFIKLTTNQDASTKPIVRTIWAFYAGGLIWIVFSFCIRVLNVVTVRLYETETIIEWKYTMFRDEPKIALVTISFLGFTVYDVVYFMAITNYVVQSEMIIYLTHSVMELVKRKQYPSMDVAVKDICDIRGKLHKLNGKTSAVAAMALINVASNVLSAYGTLEDLRLMNRSFINEYLAAVTAVLQVILWAVPLLLPFIQAARVSYQCDKLKETGFYLRTRPFEYSKTPMPELDSYLVFTLAAKLRATMCGIPIYPWLLYALLVLVTMLFLFIFNMEDYDIKRYVNG